MLTNNQMEQLFYLLETITVKQSYRVLIRLQEVPPEDSQPTELAMAALNGLTEAEMFKVLQQLRKQYDKETWDILTKDY